MKQTKTRHTKNNYFIFTVPVDITRYYEERNSQPSTLVVSNNYKTIHKNNRLVKYAKYNLITFINIGNVQ